MKNCKNDAPGMKGCRSRNQDGQLRDKRDDTHMGSHTRSILRSPPKTASGGGGSTAGT